MWFKGFVNVHDAGGGSRGNFEPAVDGGERDILDGHIEVDRGLTTPAASA